MKKAVILSLIIVVTYSLFSDDIEFKRELSYREPRLNGSDVEALQKRLIEFGYTQIDEADGWFGPLTESAIMEFQSDMRIEENGIIDKLLWECIFHTDIPSLMKIIQLRKNIEYEAVDEIEFDYIDKEADEAGFPIGYQSSFVVHKNKVSKISLRIIGDLAGYVILYYLDKNEKIILIEKYQWYYDADNMEEIKMPSEFMYVSNGNPFSFQNEYQLPLFRHEIEMKEMEYMDSELQFGKDVLSQVFLAKKRL